MSARADILAVLLRTPQPRSTVEILEHVRHLGYAEVHAQLQELKADGILIEMRGYPATLYILRPEARIAMWNEGDNGLPGPAIAACLLVLGVVAAILCVVGAWYAGQLLIAVAKAAL